MKKLLIILLTISSISTNFAQELKTKSVKTKVEKAVVFLKGAQVLRTKVVAVPKGESLIKFVNLSPFINKKTIQVSASGNIMVLAVNQELNYIDKAKKPKKMIDLEAKYKSLKDQITLEKTHLSIIDDQISFLKANRNIGGKNQNLSVSAIKSVASYYETKLTELKLKQLKRNKNIAALSKKQKSILKEIQKISDVKVYPSGEIIVKVSAKQATTAKFSLMYNVKNAGWYPTYDLRVGKTDEPLNIVYKANVKQDTKVDWNNVKLTLSSSNPNTSGEIPSLIPYKLSYYSHPPKYTKRLNTVSGTVVEVGSGEPLPGVNVVVKGTTIGASTDFDGHFSISIPNNNVSLVFSYIGYKDVIVPANVDEMNIAMKPSSVALAQVVVTAASVSDSDSEFIGYGSDYKRKKRVALSKSDNSEKFYKKESIEIPINRIEKQTSVNFDIKRPYTVKSINKVKSVEITQYNINATYQYIIVPKVNKDAFLLGYIPNWEKYNLLSGNANVFVEGTSIGKSLLDTGLVKDTLEVALGVDKGISVNRVLKKETSGTRFLGSKRSDMREWTITVKNNKNQQVSIKLLDQIPVSVVDKITVEVLKSSKGVINKETGEVVWEFKLSPGEKKIFTLQYLVKSPRYRNVEIE